MDMENELLYFKKNTDTLDSVHHKGKWREYLNPSFSSLPQQWPVETARSALPYYLIHNQSIILN